MSRNFPAAPDAALLVIDLQKAIDHPSWGERNNPQAEQNIAALLHVWRATRRPIYHIGHDSMEPGSPYHPGQPGNEFKPEAQPLAGEVVIRKRTITGAVSVAVRIKKVGLSAEAAMFMRPPRQGGGIREPPPPGSSQQPQPWRATSRRFPPGISGRAIGKSRGAG